MRLMNYVAQCLESQRLVAVGMLGRWLPILHSIIPLICFHALVSLAADEQPIGQSEIE
jgi:hypothetical protein